MFCVSVYIFYLSTNSYSFLIAYSYVDSFRDMPERLDLK